MMTTVDPRTFSRGSWKGRDFLAPRDHQAHMYVIGHVVGREGGVGGRRQLLATLPDTEIDGLGALEKTVEMIVKEGSTPLCSRIPSQTPSPMRKPESYTETTACERGTISALT